MPQQLRLALVGLGFQNRNRHRAGWRFLRFTMIVTVYGPICSVIRIMPHLLSEESASRPLNLIAATSLFPEYHRV